MRALAAGQFKTDFGNDCNANYVPADCQCAVNVGDLPFVVYTETREDKQISDFVGGNLLKYASLNPCFDLDYSDFSQRRRPSELDAGYCTFMCSVGSYR